MEMQLGVLGERIRGARQAKGWTQAQLAARLGVVPVTVSQWETGIRRPEAVRVRHLADTLGVPVSYLFGTDVAELRAGCPAWYAGG